MNENWKYIKIEKCLEKVKYTEKIPSSDYKQKGTFPIVSQEEELISGYWDSKSDVYKVHKPVVVFGDHTRILKYVDFDFVLGADGVKILQPIDTLSARFLLYYLKWYDIPNLGYSRHYKLLKEIDVPIPPISEQERIVAELDLLTGVIEKQKAQLKELDNLAQSIFYDMFGDPYRNSKNWTVKKLSAICDSELGKTLNSSKDTGLLYPYLCSINVHWNELDLSMVKQTRFEESELDRYSVKKGDLLVCEGGDIGRSAIWTYDENIRYQNALHRLRFHGKVIAIYCLFVLWYLKAHDILDDRYGKGVTIKHLVKSSLMSIEIPIPPLQLQQQFAEKIEAIEHQKTLIKKSIEETQKLFDYTMDKYFG